MRDWLRASASTGERQVRSVAKGYSEQVWDNAMKEVHASILKAGNDIEHHSIEGLGGGGPRRFWFYHYCPFFRFFLCFFFLPVIFFFSQLYMLEFLIRFVWTQAMITLCNRYNHTLYVFLQCPLSFSDLIHTTSWCLSWRVIERVDLTDPNSIVPRFHQWKPQLYGRLGEIWGDRSNGSVS